MAMGAVKPAISAGTASACCTPPPDAWPGLDLGLVPGDRGPGRRGDSRCGRKGRDRCRLSARRRRDRHAAARQRLRHLSGQPRRSRRPPRRRHPARRRLYREGRDLRQHRRPPADDGARRVPAGRGARGLEDHPRAVRRARPGRCRSTPLPSSRATLFAARPHLALLDQIDPADSAAIERLAAQDSGKTGKDRFGAGDRRLLSDQSRSRAHPRSWRA